MKSEECRDYFRDCGLSYSRISELDVRTLISILETEFKQISNDGFEFQKHMKLKVRSPLKKDIKSLSTGLSHAYIKCDGSYFSKREAISFNNDGFIGFCGWADYACSQPILRAFIKWCDWMVEKC